MPGFAALVSHVPHWPGMAKLSIAWPATRGLSLGASHLLRLPGKSQGGSQLLQVRQPVCPPSLAFQAVQALRCAVVCISSAHKFVQRHIHANEPGICKHCAGSATRCFAPVAGHATCAASCQCSLRGGMGVV